MEELREVEEDFAERSKHSANNIALPASDQRIDFGNVQFDQFAVFEGYLFSQSSFVKTTFSRIAVFTDATFTGNADFARVTFSRRVRFDRARFSRRANFSRAIFSGRAMVDGATFSGEAIFRRAAFSGSATFKGATFRASSSFVNAEMNRETSFEGATFETKPPKFFGAKLHQGTVWRGIKWPQKPKDQEEAARFIDAYACLKLERARLKKHEDELDFFALELKSRRIAEGTVRGFPIAIYGFLSDYGRGYTQPLYALFAVAAIGTLVLLLSGSLPAWQSLGLSIANTINVFGFRKDFFDAVTIECLPASLKILAAVQTILGTILLFLFGFGVRNKFRMK